MFYRFVLSQYIFGSKVRSVLFENFETLDEVRERGVQKEEPRILFTSPVVDFAVFKIDQIRSANVGLQKTAMVTSLERNNRWCAWDKHGLPRWNWKFEQQRYRHKLSWSFRTG